MDTLPWLNTAEYSPLLLALFGLGCLGWVVAYMATLKTIWKRKYVEIPAGAVVANVAWEFIWSFFYHPDIGRLFAWGYRAWFFLDVFITYSLFRYGSKQVVNPSLRRWFAPAAAFGIVAWTALIYTFRPLDSSYGGISGYILNVMMSFLYLILLAQERSDIQDFSALVGWSKMLGTGFFSVFNALYVPENRFLMTMCAVTFILDATYVVAFHRIKAKAGATAAAAGAGALRVA
ncbi:MAG: hypothetical protein ACJ75H_04910 [Thermoanaerobaculia bacterium]